MPEEVTAEAQLEAEGFIMVHMNMPKPDYMTEGFQDILHKINSL